MGLFGGSKKVKLPPMPSLSPMGKWAQQRVYGDMGRALAGGGMFPSGVGAKTHAYRQAYKEAQPEMESYLNRMVPGGDVRVRGFAGQTLSRGFHRTLQGLKEEEKLRPYEEQQEAIGMATDLLAGEKKMSASITDMFNRQQQLNWENQMRYGTFGSNLGYGLGATGGWVSAAQKYAQGMSGGGGIASQVGTNYLQSNINQWLAPQF